MKEEKIIYGNNIIAKFLEWESTKAYVYQVPNLFPSKEDTGWTEFNVQDIGFESRWDMLMPVIEKISRIEYDRWDEQQNDGTMKIVIDTAYPRTFGMLSPTGKPMFRFNRSTLFEAETLIEAAWEAVVDFITYQGNIHASQ